ncbi:tetratricopeptide repeat protein [Winogradskyella sp. SYSU M77433]|uniref:tetratricopeptide repeat protein n=1 Tax=Winogradskyella sp. SYSU M77433 TaxID=3042722 RepID=UPI0024801066|nr:tetratricopeptide repeat protein [Winogradskyella sp. SYSU M77433]MDH7913071.1 tetratricopeptide repeat protein [Winogradskyella sp. SYSU M77433]
MKRKLVVILLCFSLLPFIGLSQNAKIDSLENILITHKQKDTIRVNAFDELSFLYYRKDIKKAKEYTDKAEALSEELGFIKGKGNALYMRGVLELTQSNFDLSIEYFKNAAQLFTDNGFKKNIAACYNGIGVIYFRQSDYSDALIYFEKALKADEDVGIKRNIPNYLTNIGNINMKIGKYPEAIAYYKKALKQYKEADYTLGISACLKNIASIYNKQGNYPLALEYNSEALSLAEKIQDSLGISNSLNNMSLIYKNQKKYDKALELLNKSLAIHQSRKNNSGIAGVKNNIAAIYMIKEEFNIAVKFLNESLELNRKTESKSQISECLNNLGDCHTSLKNYTGALRYFEEAKKINITIDNQEGLSFSYLGLADCYVDQKKYDEAFPNILKSLEISNRLELLDYQSNAYQLLTEVYENRGDYEKALENHQKFKVLNDSLFNKESTEKIAQLEYEYKYKQALDSASIRELKLTKTVISTSQDLQKSKRNLFLGVIGFLITIIILGGIIFSLKLRHQKAKTQNIAIEQKLLRSQMTPHFIFNSLSVLQGMILNKEDKKSVFYLSKFSKLLRLTLENSRDKLVPLNQELEAVNSYLELQNLEESESYDYTILVDKTIDETLYKIPPMLIQPFIENAIEHAFEDKKENRKIDIQLKCINNELICTIKDNGIGIDAQNGHKRKDKKSLATTITSERLKMLSKDFNIVGSVKIEDRKLYNEEGTLVTLVIPYKKEVA